MKKKESSSPHTVSELAVQVYTLLYFKKGGEVYIINIITGILFTQPASYETEVQ